MLILLSMRLSDSLNPRDWSSIRANQRADQAQRAKKSWLFGEPHIKNKIFQEDRAKDCQEIEELRNICCEEADRARQLKIDERSMQQRERIFPP